MLYTCCTWMRHATRRYDTLLPICQIIFMQTHTSPYSTLLTILRTIFTQSVIVCQTLRTSLTHFMQLHTCLYAAYVHNSWICKKIYIFRFFGYCAPEELHKWQPQGWHRSPSHRRRCQGRRVTREFFGRK